MGVLSHLKGLNWATRSSLSMSGLTSISVMALPITLFIGFLAVGLELRSAFEITLALMLYSIPFYLLSHLTVLAEKHSSLSIVIGFGLGTVTLSILFGFTPLADHALLFLLVGVIFNVIVVIAFLFKVRQLKSSAHRESTKDFASLLVIGVAVAFSAIVQRITWPFDPTSVKWLPDDAPIFAEWGRNLALGGLNQEVIDGFTLKYHWLSYSFLGGLDHLFSENYISGSIQIAPIIAWTGLAFGALALTRLFTKSPIASLLGITGVLFANSVGILAFSRVSLGGVVVSPSHLLSGFWIIVIVLIGYFGFSANRRFPVLLSMFLLPILGFTIALTKFSAFAVGLLCLLVIGVYQLQKVSPDQRLSSFLRSLLLLTTFVVGGLMAFVIFLAGSTVEIAIDPLLIYESTTGITSYMIQLMPLAAIAFSLIVLMLPSMVLNPRPWKTDPLFSAAAVLSLTGLIAAIVLQLRDSNETWYLAGALALILPLSAVLIVFEVERLTNNSGNRLKLWIVTGLTSLVLTAILLLTGESTFSLVRPWFTPTLLVLIGLLSGVFYLFSFHSRETPRPSRRFYVRACGSIVIITLFITSVVYGIGLRVLALTSEVGARADVSLARDAWLAKAQDLIETGQFNPNNTSIAVYSTSEGEQTIARWIPYLANKDAYFIRDDDLLRYIYVSTGSQQMSEREALVREFIEERSSSSCLSLREDGIFQIWVTPNASFSDDNQTFDNEHNLVDVLCESL